MSYHIIINFDNRINSPELLLAGRVPKMEFDSVSVELNVTDVEVHSYSCILSRPEGVVSEASMHAYVVKLIEHLSDIPECYITSRVQFFQRCCHQLQLGEIGNHSWDLRV